MDPFLAGVMTCMLCVISCGCGCSCGLFVIAVVWLYMRPLSEPLVLFLAVGSELGVVYWRFAGPWLLPRITWVPITSRARREQSPCVRFSPWLDCQEGSRGLGIQELAGLTSNEGNEAGA